MQGSQHPASFRDPSGFVFNQSGVFYRAVQPFGQADYDRLMSSGLYQKLADMGLIIGHEELAHTQLFEGSYKILKPTQLDSWIYPYEWSFSQLKEAALLTLKLINTGLEYGMILKDAHANNIQFAAGRPLLIDSLSFEIYNEGESWQAFNQFRQHFLYPLLVFSKCPQLSPAMLMAYPDGLSAQLTAALLPYRSRFSWKAQLYVYLASALTDKKNVSRGAGTYRISRQKILQNVAQLEGYIRNLSQPRTKAGWSNYYDETILSEAYLENKKSVVTGILEDLKPTRVIDAGCNTGEFSIIASALATEVIAFDNDAGSIDVLYRLASDRGLQNLQVLVADITNPTPALGWANAERSALNERVRGDMVLALALVHHLALAKNVPFSLISFFFADIASKWLLIEFVPKSDPKAQLLLQSRKDIFSQYTQQHFEEAFRHHFSIEKRIALNHSERILYLLRRT